MLTTGLLAWAPCPPCPHGQVIPAWRPCPFGQPRGSPTEGRRLCPHPRADPPTVIHCLLLSSLLAAKPKGLQPPQRFHPHTPTSHPQSTSTLTQPSWFSKPIGPEWRQTRSSLLGVWVSACLEGPLPGAKCNAVLLSSVHCLATEAPEFTPHSQQFAGGGCECAGCESRPVRV